MSNQSDKIQFRRHLPRVHQMTARAAFCVTAVPLAFGCGGESVAPYSPSPLPPPIVRVQLADIPHDIFEGWPVVVGSDTLRFTTSGRVTHHRATSGVPLSVYVPPEAIERRFVPHLSWEGGYRSTDVSRSGIGAIMDTVHLMALNPGDNVLAELNYRADFVLGFRLIRGRKVDATGQWLAQAGIPDARVTIDEVGGGELAVLTTDFNGEVFIPLRAVPHIFEPEAIRYHFDAPAGYDCPPHAVEGVIPIAAELKAYRDPVVRLTGLTLGAICVPSAPPSRAGAGPRSSFDPFRPEPRREPVLRGADRR